MTDEAQAWCVYMLDCDGRIYTGIARDPGRRFREHVAGKARAAKFTRGAATLQLLYQVRLGSKGLALQAEYRIKRLGRAQKTEIIHNQPGAGALLVYLGLTAPEDACCAGD